MAAFGTQESGKVMSDDKLPTGIALQLGSVEPHKTMLAQPPDDQRLFKVMRVENFLSSVAEAYLHFNRVDSYKDFAGADSLDGKQLAQDQAGNAASAFLSAPHFTVANYYDQSRSRTYSCCLSVENSDYIWQNYGNGGTKGKVGLVFEFGKLRTMLNTTFESAAARIEYDGLQCRQIFSINYGLIQYVDWNSHRANLPHLPNPMEYIHLKDKSKYGQEKELRISLSALGLGRFTLNDDRELLFPPHLHYHFDFRAAISNGTLCNLLRSPDADLTYLHTELQKLGLEAVFTKAES